MVVQGYNPALMRPSQDECELYNSLGRKGRWVLKSKLGMCNPNLPVIKTTGDSMGRQVLCPLRMVGKRRPTDIRVAATEDQIWPRPCVSCVCTIRPEMFVLSQVDENHLGFVFDLF